ncbi:MAG: class A beta-lactamase-related serine hydrolase [Bacteroidetes bacterium]|nr:class A beta-lactamase-related serine hydrolase [Bacteroidota bacterium]
MKKIYLSFVLLLGIHFQTFSQSLTITSTKTDKELTRKIEQALAGFRGQVGVYVRNLRTNRSVAIKADSLFPTASMVKIPILCGVFDKIAQGELSYTQVLTYRDSLRYDDGVVGSLRDSSRIPLSYVLMLMETLSDNTGSLWLQSLAGGGTAINEWLQQHGFEQTRVNSRTPGRENARETYGWGQTSPREMAELMVMIREGRVVSPAASERMYRLLGRQFWDAQALSQIPPSVQVIAKNGAVNQAKSEVVLVHAPHGEYVFCITTKNQEDQRWTADNEGYVLLRTLSGLIWNHFEPDYPWQPLAESPKWQY